MSVICCPSVVLFPCFPGWTVFVFDSFEFGSLTISSIRSFKPFDIYPVMVEWFPKLWYRISASIQGWWEMKKMRVSKWIKIFWIKDWIFIWLNCMFCDSFFYFEYILWDLMDHVIVHLFLGRGQTVCQKKNPFLGICRRSLGMMKNHLVAHHRNFMI